MADNKVMIIDLEPSIIDFSDSFFANSPGLNATKILDGLDAAEVEKLINVVHEQAPYAKLCFNTNPGDTAEAVKRWL